MALRHKVAVAALGGAVWIAALAAQAADVPIRSLVSASHPGVAAPPGDSHGAAWSDPGVQQDRAAEAATAGSDQVSTEPSSAASSQPTVAPPGVPATRQAPTPATTNAPQTSAYDAGGSMSGSSSVSQVYQQSTQSGFGCQAALQYLSQHANPEFSLVCPGDAMGHQAMTCYYRVGVCPDSAEIVIADPCPAAYENEAWNSWHVGTGPYDPYGWCSDWPGQQGPSAPAPPPLTPTGGPDTPAIAATSGDGWWQPPTRA